MIQVYKIAHNNYDNVTTKNLFKFSDNQKLRGHNFKIMKQRAMFFTNRIVNRWNKLPSEIVNAKSINNFKNLFDGFNKHIQYKIDIKEN